MGILSPKQRAAAPKAGPNGSFPIPDVSHAQAALRDAPKSENAGNISHGQEQAIEAKVHAAYPQVGAGNGPSPAMAGLKKAAAKR